MIKRLLKLQSDTLKWGVMNAEQMLSYCLSQMQFAFGELKLNSNLFMRIIGKIYKNKVVQAPRFKKTVQPSRSLYAKGSLILKRPV